MSKSRSTSSRRGRLGWISAVCSALVGLFFLASEVLTPLSFDTVFWFRDDISTTNTVIVYMDEESHARLAQPWHVPWDRTWHARLIDRLTDLGARVIAFDVLFEHESNPAADHALVEAARRHGKVVVAAVAESGVVNGGTVVGRSATRRAFPDLVAVSTSGVVEQAKGKKFIRQHYLASDPGALPSLAWQAASLSGFQLPPGNGERWINYYGPPGVLPHLSYFELFQSNNAPALAASISNQVVFVGARYSVGFTGGKDTDDFETPYTARTGRWSPGVEINATTFLNLARKDWMTRFDWPLESLLVVLAGLGLGAGLLLVRPLAAAALAVVVALTVGAGAIWIAWTFHLWFPWCVVVLTQLPVAAAFSVLGQNSRLAYEKRAFEQALALSSEGRGTTTAGMSPDGTASTSEQAGTRSGTPASSRRLVLPEFLRERTLPVHGPDELPRVPDHELIRRIGQGGYGEVWLARDILGSLHAVKLLHLADFPNTTPLQTEFEGLKRFTPISRSHPGLLHILHVGRDESKACLYYVMELADNDSAATDGQSQDYTPRTLASELARRGRLPLAESLELGIALAEALHHLHTHHLVHRDIKPANIVYVKGHPKLADVGLVTEAVAQPNGSHSLGTPGRIAPEGGGTAGADVFSLGKVLYEAGLGMDVTRFPELPASMIQSGADRNLFEFNRVIMRACDVDPASRWSSAGEFADALRRLRERLPASPAPGNH